jgi:predicted ArsR family transcriptional regulator
MADGDQSPLEEGSGDAAVLAAVGEEYSAAILAATDRPRSARELSELLEVPIATCYRRIEALVAAGLLEERGRELSDRGRRTSVYRRTVEGVSLGFDGDSYEVDLDRRDDAGSSRSGDR